MEVKTRILMELGMNAIQARLPWTRPRRGITGARAHYTGMEFALAGATGHSKLNPSTRFSGPFADPNAFTVEGV